MSLTELFIKIVGVLFVFAGANLVLTSVGLRILVTLTFGTPIMSFVAGLVLLVIGIAILRGKGLSL